MAGATEERDDSYKETFIGVCVNMVDELQVRSYDDALSGPAYTSASSARIPTSSQGY